MLSEQGVEGRVSFGLFEADLQTGELWKAGRRVRLQDQPFKVLAALLERPGEVVTRAEVQALIWGKDAVGDFDQSIGTAVNKIREALGDHAGNPRFIETLARRGYRFIAPVSGITRPPSATASTEEEAGFAEPELLEHSPALHLQTATHDPVAAEPLSFPAQILPVPSQTALPRRPWRRAGFLAGVLLAFVLGALLTLLLVAHRDRGSAAPILRIDRLTHMGNIAPGTPGMEGMPASASDGLRIFVPVLMHGRNMLTRVDIHSGTGEPVVLPDEIASPMLGDLSPDLSTLLLRNHLSPESEQPLWLVPTGGGSALRLPDVLAHDATWMPDGKSILYAKGNQLVIHQPEGGTSTVFATLPGRALWLRWSPDGNLLRFTLLDPLRHTMGLWQIDSAAKHLRMVLNAGDRSPSQCCGVWADEGRSFVFQASKGDHTDLWRLEGKDASSPVRVTDGPLDFVAPVASSHGSRIYFLGLDSQSRLERYDAGQSRFVPEEDFLRDASRVAYSRDQQWVVWVDQSGRAWRAKADGSERIQLTPNSLEVFLAQWSPDGQQVALMAKEPGKAWQLYLVSAEGGTVQHLPTDSRNAADPSWSADGREIVFGRVNDTMGNEGAPRFLEILNIQTGAITPVPGSDGLFSPRWSPDGRYIAALSLDQHQILLFHVATKTWQTLAQTTAADPVWAANSASIYFHASLARTQPIYRASIPDGQLHQIASLANFPYTATDYFFSGLTTTDAPIIRSRAATGDLYTLDLEEGRVHKGR